MYKILLTRYSSQGRQYCIRWPCEEWRVRSSNLDFNARSSILQFQMSFLSSHESF